MRRLMMTAVMVMMPALVTAEVVGNLNPRGDNYLSLRAGPSTKAKELRRMGPGTGLTILGRDGVWRHVRTEDGREGWAHSKYILKGGSAAKPAPKVLAPKPDPAPAAKVLAPKPDPAQDRAQAPTVLAPAAVPSAPTDPLDWLAGHLSRYHAPLAYYP